MSLLYVILRGLADEKSASDQIETWHNKQVTSQIMYFVTVTSHGLYGVHNRRHIDCLLRVFFSGYHQSKHQASQWPMDPPYKSSMSKKRFPAMYNLTLNMHHQTLMGFRSRLLASLNVARWTLVLFVSFCSSYYNGICWCRAHITTVCYV